MFRIFIFIISISIYTTNVYADHTHEYKQKMIFCKDTNVYDREACTKEVSHFRINSQQNKDIDIDKSKYKPVKTFKAGDVLEYTYTQTFTMSPSFFTKIEISTSKHYFPTDKYCVPNSNFSQIETALGNIDIGFCPNESKTKKHFTVFYKNKKIDSEETIYAPNTPGYTEVISKFMFNNEAKIVVVNKDTSSTSFGGRRYEFMTGEKSLQYFIINNEGKLLANIVAISKRLPDKDGKEYFIFEDIIWGVDLDCVECDKANIFIHKRTNQYATYDSECTNTVIYKESIKKCGTLFNVPPKVDKIEEIISVYKYQYGKIIKIWENGDDIKTLEDLGIHL